LEARSAGASAEAVAQVLETVREVLGPAFGKFQELTERRV
jgi:hypothetical protein